jgi:hypothetical protein
MQEARDFGLGIHFRGAILKYSYQLHLPIQIHQAVFVHSILHSVSTANALHEINMERFGGKARSRIWPELNDNTVASRRT